MARKRTARNVVTTKTDKATKKVASVQGRPGFTNTGMKRRLPTIPPFRAKTIRTLIKRNQADGRSLPEGSLANTQNGQIVSTPGVTVIHKQPQVPPGSGRGSRVITPPSPTNEGGVRDPFNRKRRVGRMGQNDQPRRGG